MIVLGVETATMQVSVAIGGFEGVLASFEAARGPRHIEVLTPAIEFVSRQSGVALSDVSVIAVDTGPGLFSGLRVGVATAKALAHALEVPMVTMCSLDLLAFPFRYTRRLVVATIDARRGEVYSAAYRQVPGGIQRLDDPRVRTPEDLAAELEAQGEECLLVGDGAVRHADAFRSLDHAEIAVTRPYPSATALVELAHPVAVREEYVQPEAVTAEYLRRSDAEITWDRRTGAMDGAVDGGSDLVRPT